MSARFRLSSVDVHIRNPLTYPFVSKSAGYLILTLLCGFLVISNIQLRSAEADVLAPSNVLAHFIGQEFDELLYEEFDEYSGTDVVTGATSGSLLAPTVPDLGGEVQGVIDIGDIATSSGSLIKPTLPTETELPATVRDEFETYVVTEGDTLSQIADRYDITTNTLLWANGLTSRSTIRIGQKLTILPTDGVLYRVRSGDTLQGISNTYDSTMEKIIEFNKLAGADTVRSGQLLLLPGGTVPAPTRAPSTASRPVASTPSSSAPASDANLGRTGALGMIWPTSATRITQYFGWSHTGIDIAGPTSNKIYAAASGTVTRAATGGWNGGYGSVIDISHGNGISTRYAHASKVFVSPGEQVVQGQVIAMVGSTGRSTGPHLHFEVMKNGAKTNPLNAVRR